MAIPLLSKIKPLYNSIIVENSLWGLISNIINNLFLSLFFIIIARQYSTTEFANYVIANTMYQFVAAFSALGLGQWFIREYIDSLDKKVLIHTFLKIQLRLGALFFFVGITLGIFLYEESTIRILIILLGINIVFDNVIYAIKHVNIAEYTQKKTFVILAVEAISKFVIGCLLLIFPMSIISLSVLLILLRFGTLNLFLRLGSPKGISLVAFWKSSIAWRDIKNIIMPNWPFVIIGGISIIYWRISSIIVSKFLTAVDVANYEITLRVFGLAQILPLVVSTTVFPKLIKLYQEQNVDELTFFFNKIYKLYLFYALLAYTFIYSFADILLPFIFGFKYGDVSVSLKQIFLTILVFPTALLQANLLIAMKLEKLDMVLNIISLILNIILCIGGLYFYKSLTVINYAIFISFSIFHISQSITLINKGFNSLSSILNHYIFLIITATSYTIVFDRFSTYTTFIIYWTIISFILVILLLIRKLRIL